MQDRTIRNLPLATIALVAANVLIYIILEIMGSCEDGEFMYQHGALYAADVVERGAYWQLLTSMFLHFGISHLMNNMLMLYLVGERLERAAGHVRFAVIYLVSGILANAFTAYYYAAVGNTAISAGASGAIMGIIGAMFGWIIRSRGSVGGVDKRGIIILAFFSLYSGVVSSTTNNAAHISGMLFGFLLGLILYRKQSRA